jgi:hypothetical protein
VLFDASVGRVVEARSIARTRIDDPAGHASRIHRHETTTEASLGAIATTRTSESIDSSFRDESNNEQRSWGRAWRVIPAYRREGVVGHLVRRLREPGSRGERPRVLARGGRAHTGATHE